MLSQMKLPDEDGKRMRKKVDNWVVYLVECRDGTLYCGATNNVDKRVATHNAGKGAKYTKYRLPVSLLLTSKAMPKWDALRLERAVKKQKANEKVNYLQQFSERKVR